MFKLFVNLFPIKLYARNDSFFFKCVSECSWVGSLLDVNYLGRNCLDGNFRSYWSCSVKKASLKNLAKFTGKHLYWSLFLLKLQAWTPASLSKKDTNTYVFLFNLLNFKSFPILKNICERLVVILQEELLNSSSRILHFNVCLQIFQIFYSGQYIPVW